nr:insertion sequence IS21 putative ATP-binding protein [Bradyrhizobium sp. DOA9]
MARAKRVIKATTDPLDAMLARLQLSGIRDQLDSLLDEAARANLSTRETLILLCEREIARKDHRRIETALKLAHFPAVKELAGFDFDAQPSIDPKQIRDLAASRWIANGENVLLLGPPGVGKTHLSIAPGREALLADTPCSSPRRRRWSQKVFPGFLSQGDLRGFKSAKLKISRRLCGDEVLGSRVSNAIRNCPLCVTKNCPHHRDYDLG